MRCLYCGKELALLKRWTRGAQFCSDAHNKSYQEEYNRIGLSRLLQAQNRPKAVQEAAPGSKPDPNVPGPNGATVAVEEAPVPVEEIRKKQEGPEESVLQEVAEIQA